MNYNAAKLVIEKSQRKDGESDAVHYLEMKTDISAWYRSEHPGDASAKGGKLPVAKITIDQGCWDCGQQGHKKGGPEWRSVGEGEAYPQWLIDKKAQHGDHE